jgi:DNA gyrase/topoisomerase IV subunit A
MTKQPDHIPDLRDGLVPLQRRTLVRLHELGHTGGRLGISQYVIDGLSTETPQRAYAAAVVLAQDWVMRYPLIDGEGNFGSSYPDAPAGMAYTEMGLSAAGTALVAGGRCASDVLLGEFPNYFVNGSTTPGGMLSHNLRETVAALIALIENPFLELDGLMEHMPGPDLPTGGVLIDTAASVREAYATGRGSLRVRPRLQVEEDFDGVRVTLNEQLFRVGFGALFQSIIRHIQSGTL